MVACWELAVKTTARSFRFALIARVKIVLCVWGWLIPLAALRISKAIKAAYLLRRRAPSPHPSKIRLINFLRNWEFFHPKPTLLTQTNLWRAERPHLWLESYDKGSLAFSFIVPKSLSCFWSTWELKWLLVCLCVSYGTFRGRILGLVSGLLAHGISLYLAWCSPQASAVPSPSRGWLIAPPRGLLHWCGRIFQTCSRMQTKQWGKAAILICRLYSTGWGEESAAGHCGHASPPASWLCAGDNTCVYCCTQPYITFENTSSEHWVVLAA